MMNQSARKALETDSDPQPFNETPPDRCSEIRRLLLDIMAQGPWPLEQRINALSILRELSDSEREVVQQIYQLCYETAERETDEKKMWRYQRQLRSMILQKTAAPADFQRRPDPLFSLDPQMEFAVESEIAAASPNGQVAAHPTAPAAPRRTSMYDAVYPACLFAGAVLVFVLTFPSSVVDPSNVSSMVASGSRPGEKAMVSARPEPTPFEATELQLAEAAAVNEAEQGTTAREPAVSATNSGNSKETPKPELVPPQPTSAPAAAIAPRPAPVAPAKTPMPRAAVPAKPASESTQTEDEVERTNAPARRSLGPSMAVPELEAQLEALKAQNVVETRE